MNKKLLIAIAIIIVVLVAIGVYFLVIPGVKKEAPKVYRVGVLCGLNFFVDMTDAFKEKMTELGYVEGKDIVYDVYMAPAPVGNEETLQKFVDEKVDLMFVFPTEVSMEAKKVAAGTGIPIVFTSAFIEETDLVESVTHPGDNITGVRYPTTESAIGRLEILHEIAPQVKRVLIPYLKDYPTVSPQLKAMQPVASSLKITLMPMPFASPEEVKTYLNSLAASADIGFDAVLMLAEPFSVTPEVTDAVYKFAQDHKLPISSYGVLKEAYGPILGFHPTNAKMGSLAALQADKVLKGMSAGTLPVITADNDLRINYKLIQKLGLQVGEDVLGRAIEIVR